ncbi:hypothetical protein LCGC14_1285600 [marine sediment metagenome]|uniref:Uncharacterized protein n=1 Tax=marine sediment metagenome TaxID=412755 RepID=A0A0F9NX22_9ZZZZ
MQDTSREGDEVTQERESKADLREAYSALDELLIGIGLLPMNLVTTRPVLHKAVDRAMEVLDRAVKEGRYVVQTSQR